MASTGSVDGWPLGPTELGEAGLRVLLRLPTQASSSYTELKSSCARHDVRIHISSYGLLAAKFPSESISEHKNFLAGHLLHTIRLPLPMNPGLKSGHHLRTLFQDTSPVLRMSRCTCTSTLSKLLEMGNVHPL